MIDEKELRTFQTPSKKRIALAAIAAMLIAGVLLATVVLPAEYGIDPVGTGAVLRLTELAGATTAAPAPSTDGAAIIPTLVPDPNGGAPVVQGAFIGQPKGYRYDSREIKLNPREGMEIKYNMKKGAGLVYSWKATGTLAYEFHGDPDVKPEGREGTDYYETYDLDDKTGKDQAHGTFIAPSKGVHGWFWENKSENPITLKLVTAGFYEWIFENRNDKQNALKTLDPESLPGHPKIPDEPLSAR